MTTRHALAALLAALSPCCSEASDNGEETLELTCGGPPEICYEYVGSYWSEGNVKELCNATGQSGFRGTACPTEKRVGRCRYYPSGDFDHQILFDYYSPGFDASSAEADCTSLGENGNWSP